jgi:hypothetical protein
MSNEIGAGLQPRTNLTPSRCPFPAQFINNSQPSSAFDIQKLSPTLLVGTAGDGSAPDPCWLAGLGGLLGNIRNVSVFKFLST